MAEEIVDANSSHNLFTRLVERTLFRRPPLPSKRHDYEECCYEVMETLGEGGFGRVYKCKHMRTGEIVAIKQIDFRHDRNAVPSFLIREVSLLRELKHDNIVRLLNVSSKETYVSLVFELLDEDLGRYIRRNRGVKDPRIRKSFMQQILTGLAHCHAQKILHRDLKPTNLLIDNSKMMIKIADFGLAREFGGDMLLTRRPATRYYRAPEILLDSREYSTAVDLWSVGCIFGEMVTGRPIFGTGNCFDELEAIFRMLGTPTEDTWPQVSKFTHLQSYAKFHPMDLSTIFADLEPQGLHLLKMLLCPDPKRRPSVEGALKHAYFNDLPEHRRRKNKVKSWAGGAEQVL
ncbi:hypothetical protein TanjilG_24378 [Lupinus angustifolius]|uniref:cyclin-dependent kinase n=1 Tax=Lupinus angustifolius TaxID=3871 RepID=A0A1J7H5M1_LUPAN|nr:hypothetical protein TanjilG_24378 [Lupinus angustifolius]